MFFDTFALGVCLKAKNSAIQKQSITIIYNFYLTQSLFVFICWANFEIKGLYYVWPWIKKIGSVCVLYAVHTCCWVSLKWRYIWEVYFVEDVLLVGLVWNLLVCQVRVTISDSCLCCCAVVIIISDSAVINKFE